MASEKRILIVAHQTARSSELLRAVAERAASGPATFTLLVPSVAHGMHRIVDPQDHGDDESLGVIRAATPALSEAAGSTVEGIIGDANPLDAVQDAVNLHAFDEIIVSTLPRTVSKWLKLDLPHKVEGLGLPVTTVTASSSDRDFVSTST